MCATGNAGSLPGDGWTCCSPTRSGDTRYEVEIQLGATDESHIIRTIEYWDIERKRYPLYDHVAVICAEQVTSRFLNVIQLFNRAIPLIAIQLQLVEVEGAHTLVASRVVDLVQRGTEEEDEAPVVNRYWWEEKSPPTILTMVDKMIARANDIFGSMGGKYDPNYNKNYIGLSWRGKTANIMTLRPRNKYLLAEFKVSENEDTTNILKESGIDAISYDQRWGNYRVRLIPEDQDKYRDQIDHLLKNAHQQYHS